MRKAKLKCLQEYIGGIPYNIRIFLRASDSSFVINSTYPTGFV